MSLIVYNKMAMFSLEIDAVSILNYNYTTITFTDSKDATAFKKRFEEQIKSLNREMSASIKIKRYPKNKREQPIVRITGLGDIASTNFEQFMNFLTLVQQFSQPVSTKSSGEVLSAADIIEEQIASRGDLSNPSDFLVYTFKGKNIVKRNQLEQTMKEQFPQMSPQEIKETIARWWDEHKEGYKGEYDVEIGAYVITS